MKTGRSSSRIRPGAPLVLAEQALEERGARLRRLGIEVRLARTRPLANQPEDHEADDAGQHDDEEHVAGRSERTSHAVDRGAQQVASPHVHGRPGRRSREGSEQEGGVADPGDTRRGGGERAHDGDEAGEEHGERTSSLKDVDGSIPVLDAHPLDELQITHARSEMAAEEVADMVARGARNDDHREHDQSRSRIVQRRSKYDDDRLPGNEEPEPEPILDKGEQCSECPDERGRQRRGGAAHPIEKIHASILAQRCEDPTLTD
jgi:hypothetical protein